MAALSQHPVVEHEKTCKGWTLKMRWNFTCSSKVKFHRIVFTRVGSAIPILPQWNVKHYFKHGDHCKSQEFGCARKCVCDKAGQKKKFMDDMCDLFCFSHGSRYSFQRSSRNFFFSWFTKNNKRYFELRYLKYTCAGIMSKMNSNHHCKHNYTEKIMEWKRPSAQAEKYRLVKLH